VKGYTCPFDYLMAFRGDVELESLPPDDIRRSLDWMHPAHSLPLCAVHDAWLALKPFWTWAQAELSTTHGLRGQGDRTEVHQAPD